MQLVYLCRANIKVGTFSDSVVKYVDIKQRLNQMFARQQHSINFSWGDQLHLCKKSDDAGD
jgi:hypothetical protein